jgi:1,4-dihydroxy-2-naphthoate octaprenyltransferase
MVVGTHVALTGEYSWMALCASLVPMFLVSDLLLLNQFPDVDADRTVGRKHLPIAIGLLRSSYVYAAFLACAHLSVIVGVLLGVLPRRALIALLTIPLGVFATIGAVRHAQKNTPLLQAMAINVVVNLLTPLLIAIAILSLD